jgi:multidrug efflux pump subunit AcrA (membrane-fusion protein)
MKRLRSNSILVIFCILILPVLVQLSSSEGTEARDSRFAARFVQAQEVAVMSAEAPGLIVRMPFVPQDFVKEGEVLVQLDPNLIELEIDNIRSQISLSTQEEAAAVRLQYAKDNYEIIKKLYDTKIGDDEKIRVGTEKEMKEAEQQKKLMELGLRDARLEMKLLQIKLKQMQKRLFQMSIRAPWDGVIVPFYSVKNVPQLEQTKRPSAGEMVTTGQAVVAMMKVDILKVQSEVAVERLDSLYLGKRAKVYVPYDSKEAVPAKVVFISPTVDSTGVVPFEVEFENPAASSSGVHSDRGVYRYRFRPGMKARVEVE